MGCHRKTGAEQTFAVPYSTRFSNMANKIMLERITVIYNELNVELKV